MDDNYDLEISDLPSPLKNYAKAVGVDGLVKLSEAAGGQRIYIPNKENLLYYAKARHIKECRKEGLSILEIADKFQVSRATVYKKLNE